MRQFALIFVLILGFAATAKADPIPVPPQLKDFLMREPEQKAYGSSMYGQWQDGMPECKQQPSLKHTTVMVSKLPEFDKAGTPTSGQWRVVGQVSGCGTDRYYTTLYYFTPDARMIRTALLPGTTMTDARLQTDSFKYAVMGMSPLVPKEGCTKDIHFIDTKFLGFESAKDASGRQAWKEKWTLRACGATGIVTMHFKPDATGTTIAVNPKETERVETKSVDTKGKKAKKR